MGVIKLSQGDLSRSGANTVIRRLDGDRAVFFELSYRGGPTTCLKRQDVTSTTRRYGLACSAQSSAQTAEGARASNAEKAKAAKLTAKSGLNRNWTGPARKICWCRAGLAQTLADKPPGCSRAPNCLLCLPSASHTIYTIHSDARLALTATARAGTAGTAGTTTGVTTATPHLSHWAVHRTPSTGALTPVKPSIQTRTSTYPSSPSTPLQNQSITHTTCTTTTTTTTTIRFPSPISFSRIL
ncbi:hypothetical protein NUW58_g4012 [Xylaria curta]|uniref:Uncharacterized protein n=1 Tax=Xylaria curta TaxID=42375 RepID=A0ACC1P9K8_9PEZI|nr:hypothetical protein NUW58_g4012 [Xylaria curta]